MNSPQQTQLQPQSQAKNQQRTSPQPAIPGKRHFADQLKQLLPPGKAYQWSEMGDKLLLALAPNQQRFRADLNSFLIDALPQSSENLLKEWLASCSLPDHCKTDSPDNPLTTADVLETLNRKGADSLEEFQALFPQCQIVEKFICRPDSTTVDDELVDDDAWQNTWILLTPDTLAGESYFFVDEDVDLPLQQFENNFQCLAVQEFPAHQQVFIQIESEN